MKRIGILGVNAVSEKLIRGLFQSLPDAQIFVSHGNSEQAQILAREIPCWTLDTHQAVVDEVEFVIVSATPAALMEIAGCIKLHHAQTLISLVPGVEYQTLRSLFRHADCVRLLLTPSEESLHSAVMYKPADNEVHHLFSRPGSLCLVTDEAGFNFLESITLR